MITSKDLKFLAVAESVSYLSDYPRVKIGAVLVRKNDVVSVGFNKTKTHPTQSTLNNKYFDHYRMPRIHAEVDALIKAKRQGISLRNTTLYVFRRGRDGNLQNCCPCNSCREMIKNTEIKRVVHTILNGIVEENF